MRRTRQLGRYQLTDRIAFGGMAELYRGFTYDAQGGRLDVAIKKVLPHFTEDRQFLDMLTDEFKLVSHLRHPNVAVVYELAEVEESLLIAMEFVDGKDLRSTVEKAKQGGIGLDLDDMAYVLARALDGLHHAHVARDQNGEPLRIVHRDFSPSNMLVGYDGYVKICDFGIAKAAHNRVQTKTGIIKGKVKYMSPEQAFGRKLDWRSDLFSAGSVLYELVTGQAPFTAPNEIDLIFAVREATPTPVREVNPKVPPELAAIIEKAMVRSRSGRYQTAMEFRDALLAFLRRYNSSYRRTKLARFMKRIWAAEIETELRAMEEYVITEAPRADFGRNLIADALGPDAAFQQFSPNPTRTTAPASEAVDERELHQAKTEILDSRALAKQARRTSPTTPMQSTPKAPTRPPPSDESDPEADIDRERTVRSDPIHFEKTVVTPRDD